ncbi:hypothetical protein [Variovorax boronicumulans]|uniref:hypothetical protein n=1 Tax=Variovorax boronicumulans TaxID=436515 RepID=UPI00118170B7|nr:hypothetical protein [Variovorax boronicumulans]
MDALIQLPLLKSRQLQQPLLMGAYFRALSSTKHRQAARDHSLHEAKARDATHGSHGSREWGSVVHDHLSKALW